MKISRNAALFAAVIAIFAVSATSATATTINRFTSSGTDELGSGQTFDFSIPLGFSTLFKDTSGGTNDTCPEVHFHGDASLHISWPPVPTVVLTNLGFTKCSHSTTTLANGSLEFKHISGTTNATIISRNMRITIKSTVFGISCVANSGEGSVIGTATSATSYSGKATLDINGILTLENGCGDSTWTGTFQVNTPTGLFFEG